MIGAAGIIQKIPEPHAGKHGIKELPQTAIIENCAHTSEGTGVRVQNVSDGK
jgi:hypothetical protein